MSNRKELTELRNLLESMSKYAKKSETDMIEVNMIAALKIVTREVITELESLWTRLIDLERQVAEYKKDSHGSL